jgi:hypothetical protein
MVNRVAVEAFRRARREAWGPQSCTTRQARARPSAVGTRR